MRGNAYATIPTKNIEESKKFYQGKLSLELLEENEVGVWFRTGESKILVYPSEYAGTNKATSVGWDVADVRQDVADLREKGIEFEHYDNLPGVIIEGDIYTAGKLQTAWFKDPDGNILALSSTGNTSVLE